jgi:hypothetical protein
VLYLKQGGANVALTIVAVTPKPKPTPPTPNPHTGNWGDGNKPPTPKPIVVRPQVVQGAVSALCDGSVFKITKADGTVLTFAVDAKTQFRLNDKSVACSDLALGQHVYVVFTPGGANTALYVVVVVPPGTNTEHGSGGGAGTPTK